jgi:cytochrome c oxidase subunit 2
VKAQSAIGNRQSAIFAIVIWLLTVGTISLLAFGRWQLPDAITDFGPTFDRQFKLTMIVIGVAFLLVQFFLGLFIWRFTANKKAAHTTDNARIEIAWTVFTAIVFITLALLGQRVWAQLLKKPNEAEVFKVEVVAQQFQWNFHYAGRDGAFGRTRPELIRDSELNYIGLDQTDSNAKDDIVSSVLVAPANRQIELIMKSRDVTHSFWVAPLRFKQDLVPGMTIRMGFKPTRTGKYEIACAELCGVSHYKMKSYMLVVSEEEHRKLMLLSAEEFQKKIGTLLAGSALRESAQTLHYR